LTGRGLYIVRGLSHEVSFTSSSVGTTVTALVPVNASETAERVGEELVDRF
jgi:hypothetical protein